MQVESRVSQVELEEMLMEQVEHKDDFVEQEGASYWGGEVG